MKSVAPYLNRSFICPECGGEHRVGVRDVRLDEDAVERLPEILRGLGGAGEVLVVDDARTRAVAGEATVQALRQAGLRAREATLPDPAGGGDPACDEAMHAWVRSRTGAAGMLIAVGSGVINDLVKWTAAELGRPFVVVPTAASMNGYTSANVAATIKGVKSLWHGQEAAAVVTSRRILRSAPARMTTAGLGDVLAKPISTADWMLNQFLCGETYCPLCAQLITAIEPVYMEDPEGLAAGRDAALEALFEAIILTGFSMTMAGTSAPASGGEHLISHTLDMMSLLDGVPHDLHGRQVGVASLFCAALYDAILAGDGRPVRDGATSTEAAFWGRFTGVVEEKNAGKRQRQADVYARLRQDGGRWPELVAALRPLRRPPGLLKEVLRRAGAAHRLADLGVSRERFCAAVNHAHEIRERYTVIDLARSLGLLPARTGELVDQWLVG